MCFQKIKIQCQKMGQAKYRPQLSRNDARSVYSISLLKTECKVKLVCECKVMFTFKTSKEFIFSMQCHKLAKPFQTLRLSKRYNKLLELITFNFNMKSVFATQLLSGELDAVTVILKEGWTFIWAHILLVKAKVIIVQPIDVTSHLYGPPNDGLQM